MDPIDSQIELRYTLNTQTNSLNPAMLTDASVLKND